MSNKTTNRTWDMQLSNLVMFCMKNKRFVRVDSPADKEEKLLADWLTVQIGEFNRGELDSYRVTRLNDFSPDILNCTSGDMYKTVTNQIKHTYISSINPAMNHSELSDEQLLALKKLGITSDIEALNSIAWATLALSEFKDIEVSKKDKEYAIQILKAIGVINEDNRIVIRNKLARNLASRLDTTFDMNSLYFVFALMGPEGAWRIIFNGSKQEQMCARIREVLLKTCNKEELEVIATRYYKFKSLDDTASLAGITKDDVKAIERQVINKMGTVENKEYIINNMITEKNGEKVNAGVLTNFEISATYNKIKGAILGQ